jgi:uncharacterized protein (TIGR02466 family)
MILEKWFATPIWYEKININSEELSKIKDYCLNLRKEDAAGRNLSNVNGWQSHDLKHDDDQTSPMSHVMNQIYESCRQCFVEYGITRPFQINNIWVNINSKNSYNKDHDHPNSILSGSFYVDVPNNESIVFTRPRGIDTWQLSCSHSSKETDLSFGEVHYKPVEGLLLVFPSWIIHRVEPNNSDEERISVAFNTRLISA